MEYWSKRQMIEISYILQLGLYSISECLESLLLFACCFERFYANDVVCLLSSCM